MATEGKAATVAELEERFAKSQALVFTGFHGLTANEMVELRAALTQRELEYRVIKNRLALRAAEQAGLDIAPLLQGETGICFGDDDPVLAFKLTSELAEKFANYQIRGGISEGKLLDKQAALELAALPSREVLLAQLAAAFQGPVRQLATVLGALPRELVLVLSEVERTKADSPESKPEPEAGAAKTSTENETEKGAEAES